MLFNGDNLNSSSSESEQQDSIHHSALIVSSEHDNHNIPEPIPLSRIRKKNEYESYEAFSKKKIEAESERNSQSAQRQQTNSMRNSRDNKEFHSYCFPSSSEIRTNKQRKSFNAVEDDNPNQDSIHLRSLLDLEIRKNRELEQTLFARERVIVELRNKLQIQNQEKQRKVICRSASPKVFQARTVRQIEQQIRTLKRKYQSIESLNPKFHKSTENIKKENAVLKNRNRKYEKFFKAFADSLNLLNKSKCGPDAKDVWLCWKNIFPKVASCLNKTQEKE